MKKERKCTIFTKAESEFLKNALANKPHWRNDPTGIYCNRIKPKLEELLELFERKKEIEKLLQGGREL